jgi:hypothetical protein
MSGTSPGKEERGRATRLRTRANPRSRPKAVVQRATSGSARMNVLPIGSPPMWMDAMPRNPRLAWSEQQQGAEILAWVWLPLGFTAFAVTSNVCGLHPVFHGPAPTGQTFWQSTHKLGIVLLLFIFGPVASTACFLACDRTVRFVIAMTLSAAALTMLSYMNIRSAYEIAGNELNIRYAAPWTPDRLIAPSSIQHVTSGCFLGGGPSSKSPTRIEILVHYPVGQSLEVVDLAGSHLRQNKLGFWLHAVTGYTRKMRSDVLQAWARDPTDPRCVAYFEAHLKGTDRNDLRKLLGVT